MPFRHGALYHMFGLDLVPGKAFGSGWQSMLKERMPCMVLWSSCLIRRTRVIAGSFRFFFELP